MRKIITIIAMCGMGLLMTGCDDSGLTEVETSIEEMEAEESQEEDYVDSDAEPFGTFSATTTSGEEITEAIFAEYDITMVNIWATWCSPCVNEMDELQEVYTRSEDNVNMITICYDGGSETELANEILSANGAEFVAIIPDSQIEANLISGLQYFPTTIFVDSNGNIVGDKLEGAPSYDVVETYEYYIEEALNGL